MDLKVFWSELAEDKLRDIFDYYKVKANLKTAQSVVNQIIERTICLNQNPKIGNVEELLKDRKQEFRYLISTNYKIIYYINFETKRIVIANIFDCRQNPEKIKNTR
ncbi:type II toxin-antitoxin system RelE/ParE family toxin [Weeksellaceae bacterium TAE3-ERU29]|nr:type II toxin-antitoxin system RelE/ParE family toxin [Weeksellaceae bacterium TAE3-ERU29]